MATLYITEFGDIGPQHGGASQTGKMPGLAEQTVSIAGASAQSSAFAARTRMVRLHTDAICSILFGTNPTATTAKARMAANQTEYFTVTPGDKVAVISNT